jgi:flagellar basal body-associated protein FliL
MFSSISKHDNVNYGKKLSDLRKSTLDYSVGGFGMGSSGPSLHSQTSSPSKKLPIVAVVAGVILLAGGGGFAYYTYVNKKKKPPVKQQQQQQRQRRQHPGNMRKAMNRSATGREASSPQSKPKSKWIIPAMAVVGIAVCGGGIWFVVKRKKL